MQILFTFRKTYKYNYSRLYLNIFLGITETYPIYGLTLQNIVTPGPQCF